MSDGLSILGSLEAFYLEHCRCGDLDGAIEESFDGSALVWLACETCGARIIREA
jgi:hypothetical protein